MEKTYKRVPFDLETAKKIQAGEIEGKIKTNGGENARIICWDRKTEHHIPIVALIDYKQKEELHFYSEAGEYDFGSFPTLNLVLEVPDNEPQFKPFDKVLVRNKGGASRWYPRHYAETDGLLYYTTDAKNWEECIPYKGNEHLVGTTDKPE